jgi:hypothetical protein
MKYFLQSRRQDVQISTYRVPRALISARKLPIIARASRSSSFRSTNVGTLNAGCAMSLQLSSVPPPSSAIVHVPSYRSKLEEHRSWNWICVGLFFNVEQQVNPL